MSDTIIIVGSMHCKNCGFNATKENKLNQALYALRKQLNEIFINKPAFTHRNDKMGAKSPI